MKNIVSIKNLNLTTNNHKIYDNLSLEIRPRKITAIMGPSGIGKTTLLKVIGGQLSFDDGEITVFDKNINNISDNEMFLLRKKMGVLFQSGALLNDLTCFENIAYPLLEHSNLDKDTIHKIVMMKLHAVGLRSVADYYPRELSGGMQRRVALARAIVFDPELIMYDEPFTGQDPVSMGVILKLIKTINDTMGITSVIVSHDVNEIMYIADYIYILMDAKVKAHGTPQDIRMSEDPFVKQFINLRADGPVNFHRPSKKSYFEDLGIK